MDKQLKSQKNKTITLILLAILNVVVIIIMQSFSTVLKPHTIIGFEFANTPSAAQAMVSVWRENGVLDSVFFLLGFDYLFMATYSAFLWLACMKLSTRFTGQLNKGLIVLAWLQPLAAIFDATENFALFQIVSGSWRPLWPMLAAVCAAPKFVIVLSAILVFVGVGISKLIFRK